MLANLQTLVLIGFALVGPAGLPAGGAEPRIPEVRRRLRTSEPLTAPVTLALRCSPQRQAPVIAQAPAGEPLRLLRRWSGTGGQHWLQVELDSGCLAQARRGWLIEAEG